jgi:prolyl oligopeptidase
VGRYHIVLWHDRWLVITARSGTSRTTEVTVVDVVRGREPRPLRLGGLSSTGVLIEAGGRILATSTERSESGQLLAADPLPDGDWGAWRVLVPSAEPAVLAGVALSRVDGEGRLVVLHTIDGSSLVAVHDASTGARLLDVELPGHGTVAAINATDEPATLALSYADWVRPMSVWHLDLRSGGVTPTENEPTAVSDVSVIARPTVPATASRSR